MKKNIGIQTISCNYVAADKDQTGSNGIFQFSMARLGVPAGPGLYLNARGPGRASTARPGAHGWATCQLKDLQKQRTRSISCQRRVCNIPSFQHPNAWLWPSERRVIRRLAGNDSCVSRCRKGRVKRFHSLQRVPRNWLRFRRASKKTSGVKVAQFHKLG